MERWDKYAGTSKDLTWNFLEEMTLWEWFFLCVWAHFLLFPSQLLFLSPFAPCFLSSTRSQNWEQLESRAGFFLVRSDSSVDDTLSFCWRQGAFPWSTFLAHTFISSFTSLTSCPTPSATTIVLALAQICQACSWLSLGSSCFLCLECSFYSNGFFIVCLLWLRNLDLQ